MSNGKLDSFLFSFFSCFCHSRLEGRETYSASSSSLARSKSPNIFSRKTLDSNISAVNKTNVGGSKQQQQQPQRPQRARTASMPAENRKVSFVFLFFLLVLPKMKIDDCNNFLIHQLVAVSIQTHTHTQFGGNVTEI
jgi:hypothetical protein